MPERTEDWFEAQEDAAYDAQDAEAARNRAKITNSGWVLLKVRRARIRTW